MKKLTKEKTGILCLSCGAVLASWYRHNFKVCSCPEEVMIDGGDDYLRYGGVNKANFQLIVLSPLKKAKKKI
jgi:hypothetical protein